MSKRGTWLILAGFAVGGLSGTAANLLTPYVAPQAASMNTVRATREASALLGCYAQRLQQMAGAVENFSEASFLDQPELVILTRPLALAMEKTNAAYVNLSTRRLALILDIIGVENPVTRRLACQLQKADSFQWERLRPAFNGLAVNLIAAWQGTVDAGVLDAIRSQQRAEWRNARAVAAYGAQQFAQRSASCK